VDYFRHAPVFHNIGKARQKAFEMEQEILSDDFCPVLEYGISTLRFSKSFAEYARLEREAR
jgi:hypothetical protein